MVVGVRKTLTGFARRDLRGFRARLTQGTYRRVPHSVEVYVNEPALDLGALENFPSEFDCHVIPVLCDVRKALAKRGPFRTFGKGRPTLSLAVPIAPQVLGIDGNPVPAATYKQTTERSGCCGAMRARSPHGLQKSEKDCFENFRKDSEYRKTRVVSGLLDYDVPPILAALTVILGWQSHWDRWKLLFGVNLQIAPLWSTVDQGWKHHSGPEAFGAVLFPPRPWTQSWVFVSGTYSRDTRGCR
jgi:hypothetical protein